MEYTECWLTYRLINQDEQETVIYCDSKSKIIENAITELQTGLMGLYHKKASVRISERDQKTDMLSGIHICHVEGLEAEAYHIAAAEGCIFLNAADDRGILYAVFALLRILQIQRISLLTDFCCDVTVKAANPLRMLNHWDNLDGSIERGYAGKSIFFHDSEIIINERTKMYARLLSSVGINAIVLNNVNVRGAAGELISERYFAPLAELSDIFASFGIRIFLSISFAASIEIGGLASADPCDLQVYKWWKNKAAEIWKRLPNMGGFMVKADSEGRPGPYTYGRDHSEGANMLADAVAPFGGLVIWRCFVYNCQQDWRDTKTDRACSGMDNFRDLDGKFRSNVILQVKNGPMDFQVREPVAPLLGAMPNTNIMLECQITQEYTGQQKHVCYLIPWFKEILATDLFCERKPSCVGDIVSGRTYENSNCGMAAVANIGDDNNWTGHDLAAANLYGFGRLCFEPNLTAEEIAREWILFTYGDNEKICACLLEILMTSWHTYEDYTAPLGIGWMVNPGVHYGPNVNGYEYDRWGTYHRADCKGIGIDRTASGTGYCMQYHEPLASVYGNAKTCPDELILFFHHLPYTFVLHNGKTIIQQIYDTHFAGAEKAGVYLKNIEALADVLPQDVYDRMHERFLMQEKSAVQWRDVINTYFYRISGIPDEKGRKIYA